MRPYITELFSVSLLYLASTILAVSFTLLWSRFMTCVARHEDHVDSLEDQLRGAEVITEELISTVISQACPRFCALSATAKAHINWLLQAGAWTDVAPALLRPELREREVQQLSYTAGKWLCFLSVRPDFRGKYDQVAEASHDLLPLAILSAILRARVEARRTPDAVSLATAMGPGLPGEGPRCGRRVFWADRI
jgi:hypothetical protein